MGKSERWKHLTVSLTLDKPKQVSLVITRYGIDNYRVCVVQYLYAGRKAIISLLPKNQLPSSSPYRP